MCQAEVARLLDSKGNAEFKGRRMKLSLELLEGAEQGNFVLCAGGLAIEKISRERACQLGYESK
ncbi:MAG: HypC/HybG/HupF family hydrogenase formation chaperone [Candidatus Aenigmarchaeota archaeon]|nr:HypC/HybG/HupF family hydrogenase formation chaperone [Candidatus Aenigmarchaeota archaeon]